MKKHKVLYVLGAGYSGSTLLGLALGTLEGVLNLGEVASLENDYRPPALCTCSKSLDSCEFWSGLRHQLEQKQSALPMPLQWQLKESAKREALDTKGGGLRKVLTVLGVPTKWVFGKNAQQNYLKKNEYFFEQVFKFSSAQVLVDLSKTPERLRILQQSSTLDIYCIYLKRNPKEVFASNLKRPKSSRARFGFKVWREAFWYGLRNLSYNRAYARIPEHSKTIVQWESFTKNPMGFLGKLASLFELNENTAKESLTINPQEQHIYSGNLWLHRERPKTIKIRTQNANRKLNAREEQVLKSVLRILGLSKELQS